jgi:hypothetical protein
MAAIAKENITAGPAIFLATIPETNLNSIIHIIRNILNYLKILEYIKRKNVLTQSFILHFNSTYSLKSAIVYVIIDEIFNTILDIMYRVYDRGNLSNGSHLKFHIFFRLLWK